MTRFRFRLDRVLRLREGLERQRAADLGRALEAERKRLDELAAAEHGLDRAAKSPAEDAGPAQAGTLHVRSIALRAAADRVNEAGRRVQDAADRTAAERENFREARRDRETLERLREHRHEDWRVENGRTEQKDDDEIARRRRDDGEER